MTNINMDDIYRTTPPEKIPWNIEEPPAALVELLDRGIVRPCRAVEFGCGFGNHTRYLGSRGFDVTGVDISPTAVAYARERAKQKGLACAFVAADVLGDLREVEGTFGFAYDWELLHHLFPEQRKTYAGNVHRKLDPGGSYLSLCFSEQDPQFGGPAAGKYRTTRLGTRLYFSSEAELRELFEPFFRIEELKTVEVQGKPGDHAAVYAFMRRR
jgi:SAM-dependent methyltransferase